MVHGDTSKNTPPRDVEEILASPEGRDLLGPIVDSGNMSERENRLQLLLNLQRMVTIDEVKAMPLKDLPVKRKAADELDEYIYSARKNREVLMDRIPWACLDGIKFTKPFGKVNASEIFQPANDELKAYLTEFLFERQNANLTDIWRRAKRGKMEEGSSRT